MKQSIAISITTVSILIAVTSVSFTIKALQEKTRIQASVRQLQLEIADLQRANTPHIEPEAAPSKATEEVEELGVLSESEAGTDNPLEAPTQEEPEQRRESFEERMARMKEEDPEGYAERIQRREERQQAMRYNLAERTATFMDLDTTHMTEEERATHELLIDKMATIWALTEQFQNPEQAPDREAMSKLFNAIRETRPLMEQERTTMFKQLGTDLGYEGDEAQVFAEHVEDIIAATTLQMPRGGRGGRGGGGRGGGGR
jgi:hypothetical protein